MKKAFFIIICLMVCSTSQAVKKSKPIFSIPFEMAGSYVVVQVKINDSSPLSLILDSGIRNTIITELLENQEISLNYTDEKDLSGLGRSDFSMKAYVSNNNTLKAGRLKLDNMTVFVLKEDVFNFSRYTGKKINGLIGTDFFENHITEINYNTGRIYFYNDDSTFCASKGYEKIPVTVEGMKMYVDLTVSENDTTKKQVKMLIDTGAELNAWFQTYKEGSVHFPSKYIRGVIGQGLNGEISGGIARVPQICLGNYCLKNPIVSFPDSVCISDIIGNSNRDGTIGSQILNRFNYIIGFNGKWFYFKPNRNFKNTFTYNIAGVEVVQIYPFWPQTEVWKVWDDSPAQKAGILVGDQIMEINSKKLFELDINEIKYIFQTPSKSPLKVKLFRNGEEISVELDMHSKI